MLEDSMQGMPKNGDQFIGQSSGFPNTHRNFWITPARGEEHKDVLPGESDGFPPTDQHADDVEARDDFWSTLGSNTLTWPSGRIRQWDVLLECRWNVHGGLGIVGAMDQFTILKEKPSSGYTRPGERFTQIQATSSPNDVWPEVWSSVSKAARRTEEQQWATEKPELDNASKSRGISWERTPARWERYNGSGVRRLVGANSDCDDWVFDVTRRTSPNCKHHQVLMFASITTPQVTAQMKLGAPAGSDHWRHLGVWRFGTLSFTRTFAASRLRDRHVCPLFPCGQDLHHGETHEVVVLCTEVMCRQPRRSITDGLCCTCSRRGLHFASALEVRYHVASDGVC